MQTISLDEFKKKYGDTSVTKFSAPATPVAPQGTTPSYLDRVTNNVAEDINKRVEKIGEIQSRKDTNPIEKGVQMFGQGAGLAANTLETAAGEIPGVKQAVGAVGAGINWLATSDLSPIKHLGDIIGQNQTLQEVVHLYDTDKNFRDTVDGVANAARLGADVSAVVDGANYAKNVTNKIIDNVKARGASVPPPPPGGIGGVVKEGKLAGTAKNITKDILPTADRWVNTEITKALDLTQGDVKNISLATGNDVGQFIAKNNLIGGNVAETQTKLTDFYKKNYNAVRSEIGKVKKVFDKNEIPAYKEALLEIKRQISGKIGLQDSEMEIDSLLSKNKVTLSDVQRAKELMDQHFSLYKAIGDVKEGVVKTGLANIRRELKTFIEAKVKENTGVDIKPLNENVATARSIDDAIKTRSTRGLTRATISAADVITFLTGSGFTTPLGGAIAVIVKKIYQSPSFKLKFARWLDGLSDEARLKAMNDLKKGIVPAEAKKLLPHS